MKGIGTAPCASAFDVLQQMNHGTPRKGDWNTKMQGKSNVGIILYYCTPMFPCLAWVGSEVIFDICIVEVYDGDFDVC